MQVLLARVKGKRPMGKPQTRWIFAKIWDGNAWEFTQVVSLWPWRFNFKLLPCIFYEYDR